MKIRILMVMVMSVVLLTMMAAPVMADAAGNSCGPYMVFNISPVSGPPGTVVSFSGSGAWPNDDNKVVSWDYSETVSNFSTDGSGNFSGQFAVPSGAALGAHTVYSEIADQEDDYQDCLATFTVTESTDPGVTPEQPGATGTDTPVTEQSTGSTGTTTATSLPSTGFPLLPAAALALGGLGLAATRTRRRQ